MVAPSAGAATIVTFVAVGPSDALTVTNPQPTGVAGRIRLIPDAGFSSPVALQFSLASNETKSFPVLPSFGSSSAPAILAIESTDVVKVSNAPLRVGFPERHVTLPVRFNPATPSIGSLALAILNGLVRVNIYDRQGSSSPLVSRTLASVGDEVIRLRYADLIPGALAINDGYAELIPLSGQVVGIAINPPMKRRAAAPPSTPLPVLSITGSPACEFAAGVRAIVSPTAGATYRWSLVNAAAQGSAAGNALDIVLGSHGYASIALECTIGGALSTSEAVVAIDGKPAYASSSASSVTLGEDSTITWALTGGVPTSQTLSGTDFGTLTLEPTATSYTYRPTTSGEKSYALTADNPCGSGSARGDYTVSAACTTPHIDSFTNTGPVCSGNAVQLIWATSGSGTVAINNGVGTVAASGSLSVSPSTTTPYTITKTAACGAATATTIVEITQPPHTTTFTVTPDRIEAGSSGLVKFTIANPTASWSLSNLTGNSMTPNSGTGGGSFTVIYGADTQCGPDTVTLTMMGTCGTTKETVSVLACAPQANIQGGGQTCAGGTVQVHAVLEGTPPFSGRWSDGANFTTSETVVTRSIGTAGTYTLTSYSDATGTGYIHGQAVVTVTTPGVSSFTIDRNPIPFGCYGTLHFTTVNSTSWTIASALHNGFSQTSGTGGGTFAVIYNVDQAEGTDTITLTTLDACGNATTHPLSVSTTEKQPVITSFTAPATVASGASGTISFTYTDGTSYTLTSSLGNTITPTTGNSTTGGSATYTRDKVAGPDTITLAVTDGCNGTSQTRIIN